MGTGVALVGQLVGVTNLAVPIPVGGVREFQGDERFPRRLIVPGAVHEQLIDQRLADEAGQEVVEDKPLVVPAGRATRLVEERGFRRAVGAQPVDQPVVQLQHRDVELVDEPMDVVARVAD